jgi:hypothetical protein
MNSPVAMMGGSPAQITAPSPLNPQFALSPGNSSQSFPSSYEVGVNGAPTPQSAKSKVKSKTTPPLVLDGLDDTPVQDEFDPVSAASASKKRGKNKPGPKPGSTRGGKGKGRGRASTENTSGEIASTPVFGQDLSHGDMYAPPAGVDHGDMSHARQKVQHQHHQQANRSQQRHVHQHMPQGMADMAHQTSGPEHEVDEEFMQSIGTFASEAAGTHGDAQGHMMVDPGQAHSGLQQPMSAGLGQTYDEDDIFGSIDVSPFRPPL